MGSKIGNPKTAVRVELWLVFEAMAETKVKTPEMPKLPNKITRKKMPIFSIGLPRRTLKKSKFTQAIRVNNMPLKISLEKMIA